MGWCNWLAHLSNSPLKLLPDKDRNKEFISFVPCGKSPCPISLRHLPLPYILPPLSSACMVSLPLFFFLSLSLSPQILSIFHVLFHNIIFCFSFFLLFFFSSYLPLWTGHCHLLFLLNLDRNPIIFIFFLLISISKRD